MREQVRDLPELQGAEPGLGSVAGASSRPARPAGSLARRLAAEGLGTALLLASVVGSGIMGERLAGGNAAIALLANSLATGAALVALILSLGPVSGAHFNPLVTLATAVRRELAWGEVVPYVLVQLSSAVLGVWAAHYMFELPILMTSRHLRTGGAQWASEALATAGLLAVIFGVARSRPGSVPYAVGAYITAAYWFTSSTSFANPAVTIARALTDTFAGIRPQDVPGFLLAQALGALIAIFLSGWLFPSAPRTRPGGEGR